MDVSLVISIVMTVIAICAAVFSCWQARIAKATFKKTFSPCVIAYLEPAPSAGLACHLVVKNIGTEPATEIKMMASKNLPVDPKLKDIVTDFLDQEIAFLEPGGVRRTFIGSFPILIELQNEDALVTITTKETGSSTYPINVHSFTATVKDSTNIEMSLAKIAKSLDKLIKNNPA